MPCRGGGGTRGAVELLVHGQCFGKRGGSPRDLGEEVWMQSLQIWFPPPSQALLNASDKKSWQLSPDRGAGHTEGFAQGPTLLMDPNPGQLCPPLGPCQQQLGWGKDHGLISSYLGAP